MNSHPTYDAQPYERQLYDWQTLDHSPQGQLQLLPEQAFARSASFDLGQMHHQRALPPSAYRGNSPTSASPSSDGSPWSTASFPTQEAMYHPELDAPKFNRPSRGSMSSLTFPSMHTQHPSPGSVGAYTPTGGLRPHAMSLSHMEPKEEHPWDLVSWQPFNPDGAVPGAAAFFLRSPTPTKRQRTNQACEKCRERKAKCNGARPSCQRCQARGHNCEYAKERRMRGPNKTGRRGSQADIEDAVELNTNASETANRSPGGRASSETGQEPSSSEQSKQGASRARSDGDSPVSQPADLSSPRTAAQQSSRPAVPIALPTLSNGDLSLRYPTSAKIDHNRTAPSDSALRYAQSMPHIGFRYVQDALLREEQPTGVWTSALNAPLCDVPAQSHEDVNSPPSEYALSDMQAMHYSVSDVSSSSTPITPERFEYVWPTDENTSQTTFQFSPDNKPPSMLPTLAEFDGGEWGTETHADDHPVIMT